MSLDLQALRALNGGRVGVTDAACPLCGPECRTTSNRKRSVLRIWDDGAFVTFKCARCEASGWARDDKSDFAVRPKAQEKPQQPAKDRTKLAQFLWSNSLPLMGSIAETYLCSRQCLVESESLRFLPARGEHTPAMIARFGLSETPVTGVHLTKIKPDGSGKAGTDKDKIMIGPSAGQPIIVYDNPERGELLVAEGIEDAASLSICTGWTAWAAGSSGRIPAMLANSTSFDRVYCAVDLDWGKKEKVRAGPRTLERSRHVRRDIIPLHIEKALGFKSKLDANKALQMLGKDALLAAIEWSDAQASYSRGEIGFNAMQAQIARADGVFRVLAGDGVERPAPAKQEMLL